jgi:hypothetical protein
MRLYAAKIDASFGDSGLGRVCFEALLGIVLLVLGSRAGAVENAASSRCLKQAPEAAVVELLELMGMFETARAQTKAMVEQLRRENPKVPEEFWSKFASRVAEQHALIALYVIPARKMGVIILANKSYPIDDRVTIAHQILTELDSRGARN